MAIDAQRLHITENELHQIAVVPLDMIDDASQFDLAALFAHPAQRLDLELMRSSRFPALAVIPAVDLSIHQRFRDSSILALLTR
jgi:hypothetical protein